MAGLDLKIYSFSALDSRGTASVNLSMAPIPIIFSVVFLSISLLTLNWKSQYCGRIGRSSAWNKYWRYDLRADARKVVLLSKGPSKVAATSEAPRRILPLNFSGFPCLCLITKVEDSALSYRASNAEEVSCTSSIKDTFKMPVAPPEAPCV